MSTKPSATSEYITPESKPPIRTSKKNCTLHPRVCSLPLHGGGLGWGCEPSSAHPHPAFPPQGGRNVLMRDAQIGIDHRLVATHFVRRAVTNLPAVVEHNH